MRRSVLSLVIVFATAPLIAQRGEGGPRRQSPRVELQHFEFQQCEFASKSLADGSGRCGVYLPKGWSDPANKDRTWPLVVWLHGFGGYDEFMDRGGAGKLDAMRGNGDIPELVFAAFEAPGGRRGRSVYVNGDQGGKVEDAIVQDLVGAMVQRFHAAPERERHAIMGVSIGGFGALKIALHHPDVFAAVGAHSSAIFDDDPSKLPQQYQRQVDRAMQMGLSEVFGDPIDREKWAREMPMGIVRRAEKGAFAKLRIYFDAGTADRYGFAEPNLWLSELMFDQGVEHTFRLVEGGGHAWSSDSMLDNLQHSLRFVAAAFAAAPKGAAAVPAEPAKAPASRSGDPAASGSGK